MTTTSRTVATFVALVVLLGAVAAVAPAPSYKTDRDGYEATAREGIVRDCSDIHCFRVLVPWVLGRLPGPSLFKWKAYAVVASASAAVALGRLVLILGLSSRAAIISTWIAAFGAVPMFTLYDPFTADPLMFLLGPLLTADLVIGRGRRAAAIGAVGVLAKEFAAAPLWIVALRSALRRRWDAALQGVVIALGVTLVWIANRPALPTDVVNLAAVGDGAAAYVDTLQDYASLRADIICVFDGYADPGHASGRTAFPAFTAVGYLPALPSLMRGDLRSPGRDRLGMWEAYDDRQGVADQLSCERESAAYCRSMIATVEWAIAHHASIVVVVPPYVSARHRAQQRSLTSEIGRRFGRRSDVQLIELGEAIDMNDPALSVDRESLTAEGHRRVAARLLDPVIDVIARRDEVVAP